MGNAIDGSQVAMSFLGQEDVVRKIFCGKRMLLVRAPVLFLFCTLYCAKGLWFVFVDRWQSAAVYRLSAGMDSQRGPSIDLQAEANIGSTQL